ncbi:hypothetical protein QW060_24170 [Myroides ceti]|uniref:Uncharacterized protein n=1 Tax=Paenimyroides ceti TaxID=395087 RepID=A0ABT8CZK3_9FLAO|nr:hypothetical protein [Paenimyroides ceti]MDN3709757.1 hypothetical protein [Paenimyroides ceti]MDN3709967.1 hypothetical protein [Paenimyroides ceti]MDN3710002.1 hypothetical protein [Paenimyroides ceti]
MFHQHIEKRSSSFYIILLGVIAIYGFLVAKLLPIPLYKNLLRFLLLKNYKNRYHIKIVIIFRKNNANFKVISIVYF